ncbi:MAG: ABC transporter permease, partial [Sporichthyaceae bacterium]|nr:ABC transporter permease [Sporichthyaceae bacterium]
GMSQPSLTEAELAPAVPAGAEIVGRSSWDLFRARFVQDRAAVAGVVALAALLVLALAAPLFKLILHHGPNDLDPRMLGGDLGLPKGPNGHYWFGADQVGRDVFLRVLYGARTSLLVGLLATGIATLLGVVLGLAAGFRGGVIDTVVSRAVDMVLSMPLLLFAIGISTVCSVSADGCLGGLLQPGLSLVIGIIALFTWPQIARIVRGQVLSLREREFVEAARSLGASSGRIMFGELLANLVAPIAVYATLIVPANIIFEASLSFLGVGIPQSTPSWGRMMSDATNGQLFTVAWWMMLFPGLFLLLTTLAFNLVGDGLRDALGPGER